MRKSTGNQAGGGKKRCRNEIEDSSELNDHDNGKQTEDLDGEKGSTKRMNKGLNNTPKKKDKTKRGRKGKKNANKQGSNEEIEMGVEAVEFEEDDQVMEMEINEKNDELLSAR